MSRRHRRRAKNLYERKQKKLNAEKCAGRQLQLTDKAKKYNVVALDPETEKAIKPLLIESTLIKEKVMEWNLPTVHNPRKDGVVLYYAEAQNNGGYPHIVIRAIRGDKIPEEGFHKAPIRGFAVWRPSFIQDEWEVAVKRKNGSGHFEKFSASNHKEALEKLVSALKNE